MYLNAQTRRNLATSAKSPITETSDPGAAQVVALRLDFISKPRNASDIAAEIGHLLAHSALDREGLKASMVLVSDREVRLVTLLTLWDAERFNPARERLSAWVVKLVERFSEKQPRAHSSVAHFLIPQTSARLTVSDLRPKELAELVEILAAR